jgi:hypothetical protein
MKSESKPTNPEEASHASARARAGSADGLEEDVTWSDPGDKASMRECVEAVARERILITTVQSGRRHQPISIGESQDVTPLPIGVETAPSKRIRRRRQAAIGIALGIFASGAVIALVLSRGASSSASNQEAPKTKSDPVLGQQSTPVVPLTPTLEVTPSPSAQPIVTSAPDVSEPTTPRPSKAKAAPVERSTKQPGPAESPAPAPQSGIPVTGRTF